MFKLTLVLIAALFLQTVAFAKDPKPITDDTITDQVRIKLAGDPVVKGGGLEVKVEKGVATLSGSVELPKQKEKAGAVARKVKGVKQVINNIEIKTRNSGR
ncbi:MAG: transport-associated protein [Candidatus Solibacter sp.]|nr:transport-associated protein [Candidatus Solibacter sp.]